MIYGVLYPSNHGRQGHRDPLYAVKDYLEDGLTQAATLEVLLEDYLVDTLYDVFDSAARLGQRKGFLPTERKDITMSGGLNTQSPPKPKAAEQAKSISSPKLASNQNTKSHETKATAPTENSRMPKKDLYGILNLSATATPLQIRKSYHRMAPLCHPDKNPDNKVAEEQFKRLSHAHGILSNPKSRRIYDRWGEEWCAKPDCFTDEGEMIDAAAGNDDAEMSARHAPAQGFSHFKSQTQPVCKPAPKPACHNTSCECAFCEPEVDSDSEEEAEKWAAYFKYFGPGGVYAGRAMEFARAYEGGYTPPIRPASPPGSIRRPASPPPPRAGRDVSPPPPALRGTRTWSHGQTATPATHHGNDYVLRSPRHGRAETGPAQAAYRRPTVELTPSPPPVGRRAPAPYAHAHGSSSDSGYTPRARSPVPLLRRASCQPVRHHAIYHCEESWDGEYDPFGRSCGMGTGGRH
jgi:hypothetical protein